MNHSSPLDEPLLPMGDVEHQPLPISCDQSAKDRKNSLPILENNPNQLVEEREAISTTDLSKTQDQPLSPSPLDPIDLTPLEHPYDPSDNQDPINPEPLNADSGPSHLPKDQMDSKISQTTIHGPIASDQVTTPIMNLVDPLVQYTAPPYWLPAPHYPFPPPHWMPLPTDTNNSIFALPRSFPHFPPPYPPNIHPSLLPFHTNLNEFSPSSSSSSTPFIPSSDFFIPEDPLVVSSQWKEYIDDISQKCYYFHKATKKVQWEKPRGFLTKQELLRPVSCQQIAKSEWKVVTTLGGRDYFYNMKTKLTAWTLPDEFTSPISQQVVNKIEDELLNSDDWEYSEYQGKKRDRMIEHLRDQVTVSSEEISKRSKWMPVGSVSTKEIGEDLKVDSISTQSDHVYPEDIIPVDEDEFERRARLFRRLLRKVGVGPDSTWHEFSAKLSQDDSYHNLASRAERISIFESFVRSFKMDKTLVKMAKVKFMELIDEKSDQFTETTTLIAFKDLLKSDERYQKLLNIKPSAIDTIYQEINGELKHIARKRRRKFKADFFDLLEEKLFDRLSVQRPRWVDVQLSLDRGDSRYHEKNLTDGDREHLFSKFEQQVDEYLEKKRRDKQAKEDAIRAREIEARKLFNRESQFLRNQKRKLQEEQEITNVKTLYAEYIIGANIDWYEAREMLSNDIRFDTQILHTNDKRQLFEEHVQKWRSSRRHIFAQLIEEKSKSYIFAVWSEMIPLISSDSRFQVIQDDQQKEALFEDLKKSEMERVERDLVHLFKSVKIISEKTNLDDKVEYNSVIEELRRDKRWRYLSDVNEKWHFFREELLRDYIESLQIP